MTLDLSKLQNVKQAAGGKSTARCPACAVGGADGKGEHLVIYPDGKYGCAANPEDKAHRQEIFALAGQRTSGGKTTGKISVNTFKVPDSKVIMDLGRLGRFSASSCRKKEKTAPPRQPSAPPPVADETKDVQLTGATDGPTPPSQVVIPEEKEVVEADSIPPSPRWVSLDHRATGYGGGGNGVSEKDVLEFLRVTAEEFHGSN